MDGGRIRPFERGAISLGNSLTAREQLDEPAATERLGVGDLVDLLEIRLVEPEPRAVADDGLRRSFGVFPAHEAWFGEIKTPGAFDFGADVGDFDRLPESGGVVVGLRPALLVGAPYGLGLGILRGGRAFCSGRRF